jgi:ATP-independent RNA helicase DbpA
MLHMGFYDRIAEIIDYAPKRRQTLLFSATYPTNIKKLSSTIQIDPIEISVESHHTTAVIEQYFYEVDHNQRTNTLAALLAHYHPESTVVFCNTKQTCREVAADLKEKNISALEIHGDLEQRDRDQVLVRFSNNSCSVLVATDVAARGLDIKDLQAVINFDLPHDPEIYTHRIGRTGRAGKKGLALSIFTNREQNRVKAIEEYQDKPAICDVPESLDHIKGFEMIPPMVTLQIDGGRKQKVRPGDILGALTKEMGIPGDKVGKIDITDFSSYIAIDSDYARDAQSRLSQGKIKGRSFRVRKLK